MLALGETVGKSPDGLLGEIPRSGSGGSDTGGSALPGGGVVLVLVEGAGAVMATAGAEACAPTAPVAVALAVSLTCSPGVADFRTLTLTCSSSDIPAGSFPRSQADPSREGQTVNRGEFTPLP